MGYDRELKFHKMKFCLVWFDFASLGCMSWIIFIISFFVIIIIIQNHLDFQLIKLFNPII